MSEEKSVDLSIVPFYQKYVEDGLSDASFIHDVMMWRRDFEASLRLRLTTASGQCAPREIQVIKEILGLEKEASDTLARRTTQKRQIQRSQQPSDDPTAMRLT